MRRSNPHGNGRLTAVDLGDGSFLLALRRGAPNRTAEAGAKDRGLWSPELACDSRTSDMAACSHVHHVVYVNDVEVTP